MEVEIGWACPVWASYTRIRGIEGNAFLAEIASHSIQRKTHARLRVRGYVFAHQKIYTPPDEHTPVIRCIRTRASTTLRVSPRLNFLCLTLVKRWLKPTRAMRWDREGTKGKGRRKRMNERSRGRGKSKRGRQKEERGWEGLRKREGERKRAEQGVEGSGSLGGFACIRVSGCVRLLYGCVYAIVWAERARTRTQAQKSRTETVYVRQRR